MRPPDPAQPDRLSRAALSPPVPNVDDAVQLQVPHGAGMLGLLKTYVDGAFDEPRSRFQTMRRLVVAQFCNLVAVSLERRVTQPP